jgi:hypothetical protein
MKGESIWTDEETMLIIQATERRKLDTYEVIEDSGRHLKEGRESVEKEDWLSRRAYWSGVTHTHKDSKIRSTRVEGHTHTHTHIRDMTVIRHIRVAGLSCEVGASSSGD